MSVTPSHPAWSRHPSARSRAAAVLAVAAVALSAGACSSATAGPVASVDGSPAATTTATTVAAGASAAGASDDQGLDDEKAEAPEPNPEADASDLADDAEADSAPGSAAPRNASYTNAAKTSSVPRPTTTTTRPKATTTITTATTKTKSSAKSSTKRSTGLILKSNGLKLVSFGQSAGPVLALLKSRLGEPISDNVMTECGDGVDRTVWWQDITVTFSAGKFVGYHYGPHPGAIPTLFLSTAKGIGLHSTVKQLKATYPGVTVATSTLGPEWGVQLSGGHLGGFATGLSKTSKITGVFAGAPCFFR